MDADTDWTPLLSWGDHVSGPAVFSSDRTTWSGALVRSWSGTSPEMDMPALDHHLVSLHRGGPKHLTRRRDGRSRSADAPTGAVSVLPAGSGHSWTTKGPIDFTHIYVSPATLDRVVVEAFDRNPKAVHLADAVGREEPLLSGVMEGLRRELAEGDGAPSLYLDALLDTFLLTLLRRCSNLAEVSARPRCAMAPRRLKRVLDYMEAHLAETITLDDLAETAGMSRFHFSRVFHEDTGKAPYAYLLGRRVELAKTLLRETPAGLSEVMARTGFSSKGRFAANFRRITGRSPAQYRRED